MQMRAGRRRAAERTAAAAAPPAGWPLLQLPAPAQRILVAQLAWRDPSSLRLACKAAKQLVDEATTSLKLQLSKLEDGDLSSMRARFPSVVKLIVLGQCYSFASAEQHAAARAAIMQLMGPEPWLAMQDLRLIALPDEALTLAIDRCPNLTACDAAMYSGGPHHQALCALARCHTLTSLEFSAGWPSAAAMAALLSMTSLTSLTFKYGQGYKLSEGGLPDVAWDLGSMAKLQALTIERGTENEFEADEEGYNEEQEQLAASDLRCYGAMQLPASLTTLGLDRLPAPMFALPCLVKLTLERCTATDGLLGKLARSCPALEELRVGSISITAAAHATPLRAVTGLEVAGHVQTAEGVRLAGAFPGVRWLTFEGTAHCEEPGLFFAGAGRLEYFEGTCGYGPGDFWHSGASMPLSMFGPMPALRRLQQLRLNAEPAHVEGVQLLTQLTSITWVVDAEQQGMLPQLHAAFATFNAPARLSNASILFPNDNVSVPVHQELEYKFKAPIACVADAIVSWLARAPTLYQVDWNNEQHGAGALTDIQLGALAISRRIQHICIDIDCSFDPVPESLISMACLVSSCRQVHVEIQGTAY